MQTFKNIITLIIFGLWVYFSVSLAINWDFSTFADWMAYLGVIGLVFWFTMTCAAYGLSDKDESPFC